MAKLASSRVYGNLIVDNEINSANLNAGTIAATGTVTAPTFSGALSGNASTATWADTVDVNGSTSTGTFNVLWHSGDTVYSNSTLTVQPSTGNLTAGSITAVDLLPPTDNTGVVGNSTYTWSSGQFSNLTIDGTLSVRAAIDLADSDILRLGSSDDWEMYHNGTHNYIDLNAGDLIVRDDGTSGDPTRLTLERTTGNLSVSGNITTGGNDVAVISSWSSATGELVLV